MNNTMTIDKNAPLYTNQEVWNDTSTTDRTLAIIDYYLPVKIACPSVMPGWVWSIEEKFADGLYNATVTSPIVPDGEWGSVDVRELCEMFGERMAITDEGGPLDEVFNKLPKAKGFAN